MTNMEGQIHRLRVPCVQQDQGIPGLFDKVPGGKVMDRFYTKKNNDGKEAALGLITDVEGVYRIMFAAQK
jgi:hypothetical protein